MRVSALSAAAFFSSAVVVFAQTYTNCDPLTSTCPPDPALAGTYSYDFTQGPSSDWTPTGNPTYGSDGVAFTVAQQGDAPLIQSNWYIMFGKVEYEIQAAPGTGIVSSAVLLSDDLDEIDWEWLGGDDTQVQTNYFGKGDTSTYNRATWAANPGNHNGFHTYTIEWTSSQIVWQVDGQTVRVLTPATSDPNQYPQTPMMVKVGVWAGGDPSNPPGTIQWAGGVTNYADGPFTMYMKSISVTDYSTGKSYSYSGHSGSWQSIVSNGGQVDGNSGSAPSSVYSAPPLSTSSIDAPLPFSGTHKETASYTTPTIWPWVPTTTVSTVFETSTSVSHSFTSSGTRAFSGPQSTLSSSSSSSSESAVRSGAKTTSSAPTTSRSNASTTTVHAAPSAASANNKYQIPVGLGALCAFLGGYLAVL